MVLSKIWIIFLRFLCIIFYLSQNQAVDKKGVIEAEVLGFFQNLASHLLTKMYKKTQGPDLCPQFSQAGYALSSTQGRAGAWSGTLVQLIALKENPPVYQLTYVKEVLKGIFQLLLLNAKTHWAQFIHLPDYIWEQNQSVISDLAFAYDPHIRTMGQGKKSQMSSIFLNQFPCWESCVRMMP